MTSRRLQRLTALLALVLALWFSEALREPAGGRLRTNLPASGRAEAAIAAPAGPKETVAVKSAAGVRARRDDEAAPIAAFSDWLTTWRRTSASDQPALAARGRELASARRPALKHLIETDPQRALDVAVPAGLRGELPPAVQAQLERRIDDRGDLEVTIMHVGEGARIDRVARVANDRYRAFVSGRRAWQQWKCGLPLHGIVIDDAMAVEELPYRLLDDGEKSARGLASENLAVFIGRDVKVFAHSGELATAHEALVAAESGIGPHVEPVYSGGPTPARATPDIAAITSPASWILGTKRVLWLKIDFADDAGAAYTDAEIQAGCAATTDFYLAISQNKTTFAFTILPQVLRMPKDKAYYNSSGSTSNELYVAAHDAAKAYDLANGGTGAWDPDKFDRYIILHKRMAVYLYGGVANAIGGPRIGLNGTVGASTISHELGHTQSLYHSHYWLPTGTSAVGAGSHVEYGDVYDVMGGGLIHTNVAQKYKLGYLDNTSVTAVTQSGTYRIQRHDDKDAAGLRGLRIAPADLGYEYWVEHRRIGPGSLGAAQLDRLRNGVLVHWGTEKAPKFTSGPGTYLLDGTAGSSGGASDSPVRIGETFVDPDAGITIKPLAVGGTAPNEYVDIFVGFGAIDGNRNPTLQADAPPGTIAARTNVIFNATASDPDGDAIYYRWDFGDGSLQPNLGSITRRFAKGGAYSLRVSAHDGKGGIASKSFSFTVADPLTAWTVRPSGTTNALQGVIYANGRFVAGGDAILLASSDGVTWTRGSPATTNSYRQFAHNGTRFAAAGLAPIGGATRAAGAYSDDGINWTTARWPTGAGQIYGLAYGAGRFVAVGEGGRIYNSTDGGTWTEVTSPLTTSLRAIAFADNLFVATGDSGRVLTSTDGATWINRSVATSNQLVAVTRHKDAWYTTSSTVEMFTSTDGVAWTRIGTSGRTNGTTRLISSGGVLLATTLNGGVLFTEDPRSWSAYTVDATPNTNLSGLCEGNGLLVAVGSRGLISTTPVPPASPVLPAPTLRIEADSIKVAVGRKNVLSASGAGFVKLELYANGAKVSEIDGSAGALSWTPTTVGNFLLSVRGIDANGASVVSASYPAVAAFDNWKWRNPSPVGADLHGAVRADGKWWIVGGGGTLATLDDAGNFLPADFSTTQQLNGIAYANGRFVITTTDLDGATKEDIGGLWTSLDGYTWTPFLTGALDSANLNYALYAANRWIALGAGGTIVTSTDGANWPRAASNVTQALYGGVAGNGLVVAVGAAGKIITSPDGLTWTERGSGVASDLRAVTFANGTFVAAGLSGVILSSTNGTTWARASSNTTTNLYAAAFVKGAFVVAGDNGTLMTSTDGTNWISGTMEGKFSGAFGIASSGDDGLLVGRAGEMYTATTAGSWHRIAQGTTDTRMGVTYAGGRFVSVGSVTDGIARAAVSPVLLSNDGMTWRRASSPASVFSATNTLNAVAYGSQLYVAVANAGRIYTSADADTWTSRTSPVTLALQTVAFGPAGFVAAGASGTIISSADGLAWTARSSGVSQFLRGATFGNGKYVLVGDGGTILQSADGASWTAATSGVTANLLAVGWWEDVGFIATGNSGTLLSSTDAVSWSPLEAGVAESLGAIAKTSVGYVAAGGVQGTLLVSLDGVTWSLSAVPVDKTVRSLAASSGAIVAVGDSGAMLTFQLVDTTPAPVIIAQPVSRPAAPGDAVRFAVTAQNTAGAVYQWYKDGAPVFGANAPVYAIPAAAASHAGAYTVVITTPTGTATSAEARLSFGEVADPGRLINLSVLTALTSATDNFTFGVVVGGAGTSGGKALLVRAAGPSLAALGVTGVLNDPKLEFFTGDTKVGENDNWGGSAAISAVMAQVGAFPFSAANSRDAAISLPSLASGPNSAKISGTGAGTVIAELYDATPAAAFTASTPRLVNVSVLKNIGSGITAGFVIGGSSSRTVLVRAIGPTLRGFGVTGAVTDPQLALFRGSTQIGANDNWGGSAALSAAFAQVGAFALAGDSKDAAIITTLEPGNYTVQVSGVGGGAGDALVEVYEVP